MINPVLASWRRIPPQRGNTNGERVHSLHAPKLDGCRDGLRVPCGGRTVVPVQHDNTISVPVGRGNATRDICANDKGRVEAASDAHPYSLAPRSPTIARQNGLGSLSHGVEFLVDAPGAIAVDLDDTSASASTAVGSRELRTASTIEREIPH
jgi:hypothetical protein